ncbi:MarR family transcriptional regulator [Acidovorax sp. DW039]|uniref:hypothetical protein n=1 Tax=Acidovorax sp. DW039 TaxID=3095606 RepID=UPI00308909A0|nr:MarR family transcriptional regulator [Acidovorax sp. DW039]
MSQNLRARFLELFSVASRKSVFAWSEAELSHAKVLVLDSTVMDINLPSWPPCVIWLGEQPKHFSHNFDWVKLLPQNYTVSELIDILDRAAVFLMDWKGSRIHDSTLAIKGHGTSHAEHTFSVKYQLMSWISLAPPFDRTEYVRTLALMTREAATLSQLKNHSGLSQDQVRALLMELQKREVLHVSKVTSPPSGKVDIKSRSSTHSSYRRFVQRLSNWIIGTVRV